MSKYNSVDLNSILNSILVHEDVRNASLIQPADYDESSGKDPNMTNIQEKIKSYFPDLLFSENYDIYQGTIVSKKSYNGQEISLSKMGEILGYPCYKDFENFNKNDDVTYLIEINILFKNGLSEQLIGNVCKNKDQEAVFQEIARKAEIVLKKPEYKDILGENEVESVTVLTQSEIPSKILINKLITNENFSKEEKYALQNILYNLGFSIELEFYFQDHFQFFNPLHRGILISLLLLDRNYTLSPFFPLQQYPEQDKEITEITNKWELEIIDSLEKTKIASNGGKKKTHKKRKMNKKSRKI